jgi:hypothetical protein
MIVLMKEIFGMTLGEFSIVLVTVIATLVALFIGVSTLMQSASLRKREYKARLLDELKKWALDLIKAEVPNIPRIGELMELSNAGVLGEKARVALEKADVSSRSACVLFEGSYIRELSEKVFKKELGELFILIDAEVLSKTYLDSKDAGIPFVAKPSERLIVQKLENILTSGNNTLEQLLNYHSQLLKNLLGEFLVKIADVKAKLL